MNLPEKLRNLGIQQAPTDKVKVQLSEHQINTFADIFKPSPKDEAM